MFYAVSKKKKSSWFKRFTQSIKKRRHFKKLSSEKREGAKWAAEERKVERNVEFFEGGE